MRREIIFATSMIGYGVYLLWVAGLGPLRNSIQWDVAARATAAVDDAGLAGVEIAVDGRDVALRGEVASESIRVYAGQLVSGTPGVRVLRNDLTVRP